MTPWYVRGLAFTGSPLVCHIVIGIGDAFDGGADVVSRGATLCPWYPLSVKVGVCGHDSREA